MNSLKKDLDKINAFEMKDYQKILKISLYQKFPINSARHDWCQTNQLNYPNRKKKKKLKLNYMIKSNGMTL